MQASTNIVQVTATNGKRWPYMEEYTFPSYISQTYGITEITNVIAAQTSARFVTKR